MIDFDAARRRLLERGGWIPAATGGVRSLLRRAIAAVESGAGKLDREEALLDVALDVDSGTHRSAREYAQRWGWHRRHVEQLLEPLGLYRKRATGGSEVDQPRATDGPKTGEESGENSDSGPQVDQKWATGGPQVGHPLRLYSARASDSSTGSSSGGEAPPDETIPTLAEGDLDPRRGNPSVEAVKRWAKEEGYDEGDALDALTACIDAHWEYEMGSRTYVSHDWQLAIGKLCRHRKKNPKKPTPNAPRGQPHQRRNGGARTNEQFLSDAAKSAELARQAGFK